MQRRLPETLKGLILMLLAVASGPAVASQIIGEARDLRTGEFLYQELHRCEPGGALCSVAYIDLSGATIAEKSIDYRRDDIAPVLRVSDYRNGRELVIDAEAEANLVVDAGFDNFVRNNWQTLGNSGNIKFKLLVPGRDKPLPMKAKPAAATDCDADQLCLEVGLNNWLLAALTDPILLTYARDSRQLLRYRGISNLANSNGKSQLVDIRYTYPAASE